MRRLCLAAGAACLLLSPAAMAREMTGQILVLDLPGKGFGRADRSVYWDIDNDGMAEKCTWPAAHEGIVAMDINGDGLISDTYELFGGPHMDGFTMISTLDANGSGAIDQNDGQIMDRLLVWVDADGDGKSTRDELRSLKAAQINAINIRRVPARDKIREAGIVTIASFRIDSKRRVFWHGVGSRELSCDDADTKPLPVMPMDQALLARLPDLPAMGRLPSLHSAVMADRAGSRSLAALLRALAEGTGEEILGGARNLEDQIEAIMLRWARVDMMDRWQNGPYIDARRVAFIAAAKNRKYDPGARYDFWRAYEIERAFMNYYDAVAAPILLQTAARSLFAGTPVYDRASGAMEGVTGLAHHMARRARDLISRAPSVTARRSAWRTLARLVDYAAGYGNLTEADARVLDEGARASGLGYNDFTAVIRDAVILSPDEIPASQRDGYFINMSRIRDEGVAGVYAAARIYNPEGDEILVNSSITNIMRGCCTQLDRAVPTLRVMGFEVKDITDRALARGLPAAALGYGYVLYGERAASPQDRLGVTLYYADDGRLQWAMGRIWRGPAAKSGQPAP